MIRETVHITMTEVHHFDRLTKLSELRISCQELKKHKETFMRHACALSGGRGGGGILHTKTNAIWDFLKDTVQSAVLKAQPVV